MAVNIRTKEKLEIVCTDRDFEELVRNYLSDDAVEYLKEYPHDIASYNPLNPLDMPCGGECSKTYELQEYYEDAVHDVVDELETLDLAKTTKAEARGKLNEIIKKLKLI